MARAWPDCEFLLTTFVLGAFAVLVYFGLRYRGDAHPKEPPYVQPRVPWIGHIIGMMRYGAKYFELVNNGKEHPIFTLPMLSSRNYIVTDAALAGHVQRNGKTLSFYSLIVEVTRRLIAFDKHAARISMYNMNGEHGPGGLMEAVHEMINRLLAPGPSLDSMTATQMEQLSHMLHACLPPYGPELTTTLYAWQRHLFSVSNMHAVYGPENIFTMHPELEEAFWTFESGMLGLVVDILPAITARKAHLARKRVLKGLVEYVRKERYNKACPLIQERVHTNLEFGMSQDMAGHAELILMFGVLGNAVPSNFWLILNIFSRPAVLERIRLEVSAAIGLQQPDDIKQETKVHVSAKRISMKSCPLLYSCYRETLRDISLLTSARMVVEDTLLPNASGNGDYFLKKDSVVQIAGGVIHHDCNIWGSDAKLFNPERFISSTQASDSFEGNTAAPLPRNVPSSAFRAYGGGTVLCPGRHFAQSELMTLSAVLALGFDIVGGDNATLKRPEKDDSKIPLSVVKPIYDPLVKIRRRQGWETVHWNIGL